jgi:hypothetical protein
MVVTGFGRLDEALRASWDRQTCDPVDLPFWNAQNPARGQCGVTALVVQDLLGGDLVQAEVLHRDGTRQGVHYWNRLGAVEMDLTREQFTDGERIGSGQIVPRPAGSPRRCREQYEILRARVVGHLDSPPGRARPA